MADLLPNGSRPVDVPTELVILRERVRLLEEENERLACRLAFFETHSDAAGLVAEAYVVGLVRGRVAGLGCDVIARNRSRLEIKFSRVCMPKRKLRRESRYVGTCRWDWSDVLGGRSYHRLILVGDADTPFRDQYKNSTTQYILFDVPYDLVRKLATKNGAGRMRLSLNANRDEAKAESRVLYDFQLTAAELAEKYGRSDSSPSRNPLLGTA